MAEQEKEIARQRDQADATAKAQEREAEKQRKAADEAAEKAAAAEKARTEAAAASAAAAAAAPAAAPTGDARDVATQVCLAEAKSRAMAVGAKNVTMREVKDTDKKSDGRASVTASVNVVTMSSSGKIKTSKKNIKCDTRNGTVTKFKWD